MTVRYLGPEKYGLWITITTTVTMAVILDIGIASTLTNLISEAYARDDKSLARQSFTTAFWSLIGICTLLIGGGAALWGYIPWQAIFHIGEPSLVPELAKALGIAGVIFLVGIPAALAGRIMGGYQELQTYNLFGGAGSLLSLLGVVIAVWLHGNLVTLVAAFSVGPVVANIICLIWIITVHKPWMSPSPEHFDKARLGNLFRSGSQFFVIQIAGLVVFNSDNIVISHYLGPSAVTSYSVTWRLASYSTYILSLVTPALWPAYAEAFASGDLAWIRRTYLRAQRISVALLGCAAAVLALFGKNVILFWAGTNAVPSSPLLYMMCIWLIVYGVTVNQACLMGATGKVGKQAIIALLAAIANLALSVYWVASLGQTGVILGSVVSYIVFVIVFQEVQVKKILRAHPGESVDL